MGIYTKERVKITVATILTALGVIIGIWLLIFGTDYVLFRMDKPLLFSTTKVKEVDGKHYIVETGLGYYVIKDTENVGEFFVFGKKIK